MKKLAIITLLLLSALCTQAAETFKLIMPLPWWMDDTAAVAAAVSTGTLAQGVYNVSSTITVNHAFNGNGSTINYTGSGTCFDITAGVLVQNFHLTGLSDTYSVSGTTAFKIDADGVSISHCQANQFTNYGVYSLNRNSPVVQFCKAYDTGYVGMMFEINTTGTYTGGSLATDTVDRSMISAATVKEAAMHIKGFATGHYDGWTLSSLVLIMPGNPTDITAEGIEVKYSSNTAISNSTVTGGSIGFSLAGSNRLNITNSTCDGQGHEGLEISGLTNSKASVVNIINQLSLGILIDAFNISPAVASAADTILNCPITSPASSCIQGTQSSVSIYVSGCTFTCSAAVPVVQFTTSADNYTFYNCNFIGASHANYAFEFVSTDGNLTVKSCAISNISNKLLHFTGTGAADNINFYGMSYTSVTIGYNAFGTWTLGSGITSGSSLNLAATNGHPPHLDLRGLQIKKH